MPALPAFWREHDHSPCWCVRYYASSKALLLLCFTTVLGLVLSDCISQIIHGMAVSTEPMCCLC